MHTLRVAQRYTSDLWHWIFSANFNLVKSFLREPAKVVRLHKVIGGGEVERPRINPDVICYSFVDARYLPVDDAIQILSAVIWRRRPAFYSA